jgi:hypothetical protein
MTNNKKNEPEFTVTDRRRFSEEGEERSETQPRAEAEASHPAPAADVGREDKPGGQVAAPEATAEPGERSAPPTASERAENTRAYQASTTALDEQIRRELGGQVASDDLKAGFDRVVEPLYVTALVQMGFMGQEGQNQRRVDIIGARQSIDALSLLQEKTQGNLTAAETSLLEDVLYDLRMKYLEITNALARAVQTPPGGGPGGIHKV